MHSDGVLLEEDSEGDKENTQTYGTGDNGSPPGHPCGVVNELHRGLDEPDW